MSGLYLMYRQVVVSFQLPEGHLVGCETTALLLWSKEPGLQLHRSLPHLPGQPLSVSLLGVIVDCGDSCELWRVGSSTLSPYPEGLLFCPQRSYLNIHVSNHNEICWGCFHLLLWCWSCSHQTCLPWSWPRRKTGHINDQERSPKKSD